MLVITRRKGERLRIGPDLWVEVLTIKGQSVRLGFTGPRDINIVREEVVRLAELDARDAAAPLPD